MNHDLTVGKPSTVLWKFCLPLFGSMLFQQLYNVADSLVAGKFIGENALGAVGNSFELIMIFLAVAFGCNIGCSVVVSSLFGAKRNKELKTAVYTTFISGSVICVVLMVLGLLFGQNLLALIHTPEEIFADSWTYLEIYIWSLPFVFFYNMTTGIFSAFGDSKTPFWFLACSSTSNILVDILFVTAFDMGVAGVAWATFLCQGISCILAVIFVMKRLATIKTEGKIPPFSGMLLKEIMKVAIPTTLQQSFISIGNVVIQGVINNFGPGVVAGSSAAFKLNTMVITSLTTLGNGITSYTAQNLGAGKGTRVKEGCKAGLKMVWAISIPLALVYWFFGKQLMYFFMDNPSQAAIDSGVQFLRVVSPFYVVIAVKLVMDGILRGSGRMNQFMISTFLDLICRVVLAKVLSIPFGPFGIWVGWPIGWCIAAVAVIIFYCRAKWVDTEPFEPEPHENQ